MLKKVESDSNVKSHCTGRIKASKLTVIVPAHFLGCILGRVLFQTCQLTGNIEVQCLSINRGVLFDLTNLISIFFKVTRPIAYDEQQWFYGLLVEIFVVCTFNCIIIALPEILVVNKLSDAWLSIPTIPLMLLAAPNKTAIFSPAALYALRYVNGSIGDAVCSPVQIEHFIGPLIGAALAGFICLRLFPDDPKTWIRR